MELQRKEPVHPMLLKEHSGESVRIVSAASLTRSSLAWPFARPLAAFPPILSRPRIIRVGASRNRLVNRPLSILGPVLPFVPLAKLRLIEGLPPSGSHPCRARMRAGSSTQDPPPMHRLSMR